MHLGIFQSACSGLTALEKIDRLHKYLSEYDDGENPHLDLVVCPELFLTGYNVSDDLISLAETVQGPSFELISRLCHEMRTGIVYGYSEKYLNCLFNSAVFIDNQGTLLANHRKQLNSPGSFEEKYFTTGNRNTMVEYGGLKISVLICYEIEFPESARNAALGGAQLLVVPTALVRKWDIVASKIVPARAFENGIWLAYANHAGQENGFDYLGGSKIIGPDGIIEADAGKEEKLITATIDVHKVAAARNKLPYLRDYSKFRG